MIWSQLNSIVYSDQNWGDGRGGLHILNWDRAEEKSNWRLKNKQPILIITYTCFDIGKFLENTIFWRVKKKFGFPITYNPAFVIADFPGTYSPPPSSHTSRAARTSVSSSFPHRGAGKPQPQPPRNHTTLLPTPPAGGNPHYQEAFARCPDRRVGNRGLRFRVGKSRVSRGVSSRHECWRSWRICWGGCGWRGWRGGIGGGGASGASLGSARPPAKGKKNVHFKLFWNFKFLHFQFFLPNISNFFVHFKLIHPSTVLVEAYFLFKSLGRGDWI